MITPEYPIFNLHTHTNFCDGATEPEAYILEAIKLGFFTLGFSSHAPVPFENRFAILNDKYLLEYTAEIRRLQKLYEGKLNVFLSLEIDYIPGVTKKYSTFKNKAGLDYVIGGVHLVKNPNEDALWFIDGPRQETYDEGLYNIFKNDIKFAVESYFGQIREMITTQKPDIVAHLDKIKMHNKNRFFNEDEPWYEQQLLETLDVIAKAGTIVEVNTRGLYKGRSEELFPGKKALAMIKKMGIPITLNSDAHRPEELNGYYDFARKQLKESGFEKLMMFTTDGWKEVGFRI